MARRIPIDRVKRLLAERFARGELTEGQYREQLSTLRDTGALTLGPGGRGR